MFIRRDEKKRNRRILQVNRRDIRELSNFIENFEQVDIQLVEINSHGLNLMEV